MSDDDRAELEIDEQQRLADRGRAESSLTVGSYSGRTLAESHPLTAPLQEVPSRVAYNREQRAMPNLWQLGGDILALDALAEETGGEFSPEEEAAWVAMGESLYADEAAKADQHAAWIRKLESEASAQRAEAEQYLKRATTRENRVKRVKSLWRAHLEATGRKKIESATGRVIAIQANGGRKPVFIDDGVKATEMPEEFQRVTVDFDREAIYKALADGKEVPHSQLGEAGTHLRIR